MLLVPSPPMSERQMLKYFERATNDALANGLTSIHDADAPPHMIRFFQKSVLLFLRGWDLIYANRLADEGKLPVG
jgi:hypothetical protein